MINLIVNEFKKLSIIKLVIMCVIIIITFAIIVLINKESSSFKTIYSVIPFLGILCTLIAGSIVSNEYNNGTFNIYLSKPYKRYKILLSKLLCVYIIIILFLILSIVSYTLFMSIYISVHIYIKEIIKCFVYTIPLFFISTFAFFLSTITKSSSLSCGISTFIYLFGSIISQLFFGINFNIIEYSFLPYLDFTIFENINELKVMNELLNINLTLNRGIIILVINIIILYLISNFIFIKRDISN